MEEIPYFWDSFLLCIMTHHPNSFPKKEHLCGEKRIARLFAEGIAFIAYPIRVVYFLEEMVEGTPPVKVMVSVPKKRFKRAVKRNRIKRLMREAYRLNKHALSDWLKDHHLRIDVAFNYISDDIPEFEQIDKKMKSALQKLIDNIQSTHNSSQEK